LLYTYSVSAVPPEYARKLRREVFIDAPCRNRRRCVWIRSRMFLYASFL
jgi:hypothetical protein